MWLKDTGRRMLFWGAMLLLIWAAYELYIRVDAMARPLGMFFKMWMGEKIPFNRAVTYIDWGILETPFYLLLCVTMGTISLLLRRKPFLWVMLLLLAPGFAFYAFGVKNVLMPSLWQMMKMLPLLLLLIGSLLSLIAHISFSQKQKKHPPRSGTGSHPIPYDPFGMNHPQWGQDKKQ